MCIFSALGMQLKVSFSSYTMESRLKVISLNEETLPINGGHPLNDRQSANALPRPPKDNLSKEIKDKMAVPNEVSFIQRFHCIGLHTS